MKYLTKILKVSSNLNSTTTLSVIRQKVESPNGCFRKTKHPKFSEKTNISYPLIRTGTCVYWRVGTVRFLGKFRVLCFLETPIKNLRNIFNKFNFFFMGSSNLKLVKLMHKVTQFKVFC